MNKSFSNLFTKKFQIEICCFHLERKTAAQTKFDF